MNPHEDIPGRLLTRPVGRHGRLRVVPIFDRKTGRTKALRVRVFTDGGVSVVDIRAQEVESTRVDIPNPRTFRLDTRPGSLWFYADDGKTEVGFLPDQNADALTFKNAVEQPRKGRHGAHKARKAGL